MIHRFPKREYIDWRSRDWEKQLKKDKEVLEFQTLADKVQRAHWNWRWTLKRYNW